MSKDIKIMIEELEEYYECAGFEDYYNKVLKNMSDEEIEVLKKAQLEVEEALDGDDAEKMAEDDEKFHDIIFEASGNDKLIQIIGNLRIQLYRYRLAHLKAKDQKTIITEQHYKIINAIENRLPEEGSNVALNHVKYHTEYILNSLNKDY